MQCCTLAASSGKKEATHQSEARVQGVTLWSLTQQSNMSHKERSQCQNIQNKPWPTWESTLVLIRDKYTDPARHYVYWFGPIKQTSYCS